MDYSMFIYEVQPIGKEVEYYSFRELLLQFEISGKHFNPSQRKELQHQPRLAGYKDPMWGGERNGKSCIRYEQRSFK